MKLIDLLNKKANKEELPKKIRLGSHTFILDESAAFYDLYKDEKGQYLFKDYLITLNDEVETIEEKPKEIGKVNLANYKGDAVS